MSWAENKWTDIFSKKIMKNTNFLNTKCPEWRANREVLWGKYDRTPPENTTKSRIEMSIVKKIFMGEIKSHKEKELYKIDSRFLPYKYLIYSPYQNCENWQWCIEEGWNLLDGENQRTQEDIIKLYAQDLIMNSSLFTQLGWTSEQRVDLFDFLFGSTFDSDEIVYMGKSIKQPLSSIRIASLLAEDVIQLYTGKTVDKRLWLNRYEFSLQAIESMDSDAFLPESVSKTGNYHTLKRLWAYLFMGEKFHKESYLRNKVGGLLHAKCKDMTYEEHTSSPLVVEVKTMLDVHLNNGTLPEQLLSLKQWAESDNASLNKLRRSTIGFIPYIDPWTVTPESDKEENGKKEKKSIKSKPKPTVLPEKAEHYFLKEVNQLITRSLSEGLTDIDSTFKNWKQYHDWNHSRNSKVTEKRSKKDIINYAALENESRELRLEAFLRLLYPKRVSDIELDVFGEGGAEKITRVYRSAWAKVLKLAQDETNTFKIKTKKSGEHWDYEVTVVIDGKTGKHVFYYTVDSDWLDNSIFSDIEYFAGEEKLTYKFHFYHDDSRVLVAYLPGSFSELFTGLTP